MSGKVEWLDKNPATAQIDCSGIGHGWGIRVRELRNRECRRDEEILFGEKIIEDSCSVGLYLPAAMAGFSRIVAAESGVFVFENIRARGLERLHDDLAFIRENPTESVDPNRFETPGFQSSMSFSTNGIT